MKMKKKALTGLFLLLFLGICTTHAQRKRSLNTYSEQVPKTYVGQFEFAMDMNVQKKDSLRHKFRAHIAELKHTIDTSNISERRKLRLLAILKKNPFDERLLELTVMANSDSK